MTKYIQKINLNLVEKQLQCKLLHNIVVIGFDVAGHETGIVILRTTNTYLIVEKFHKLSIPSKIKEIDDIDLFTEQLDSFKNKMSRQYKFDKTIIENCFLKWNVGTLKLLARCGILVYDRFKSISRNAYFIMPVSARSIINFKKSHKKIKGSALKKEIIQYINKSLQLQITDDNIADAIVLALSGLIKQ